MQPRGTLVARLIRLTLLASCLATAWFGPARYAAAAHIDTASGSAAAVTPPSIRWAGGSRTVVTTTIQAAVNAAQPGDTILVPPGTYRENVVIGKDNIAIVGSAGAILDGTGLPGAAGIRVAPVAPATRVNGFRLNGLEVRNFVRTGVILLRVDDF